MAVAQFKQNNFLTDTPTVYKSKLDANMAVLSFAAQFSAHQASTPNMTVVVDAGTIMTGDGMISVAQQISGAIVAPTPGYQRIDRVLIDLETGELSILSGTQATQNPVPVDIPSGYMSVAKIDITSTTTAITNSMITDERTAFGSAGGNSQHGTQIFTASGTFTVPDGVSAVYVRLCGGGGGGGSGYSATPGRSGGSTSFSTYLSATGGGGGVSSNGADGIGVGGTVNLPGKSGLTPGCQLGSFGINGDGSKKGGCGGYSEKLVTGLTSGDAITVTVGEGGATTYSAATSGKPGICILEW